MEQKRCAKKCLCLRGTLVYTVRTGKWKWTKGCFTTRNSDVSESPPSGSGGRVLSKDASLVGLNFCCGCNLEPLWQTDHSKFLVSMLRKKIAPSPTQFTGGLFSESCVIVTTCEPFDLHGVFYLPLRCQFLENPHNGNSKTRHRIFSFFPG